MVEFRTQLSETTGDLRRPRQRQEQDRAPERSHHQAQRSYRATSHVSTKRRHRQKKDRALPTPDRDLVPTNRQPIQTLRWWVRAIIYWIRHRRIYHPTILTLHWIGESCIGCFRPLAAC